MSCVLMGLAVTMATTGCYRYVPAQVEATPPGTGVQLLVTPSGAQEAEVAGALDGGEPRLRGTVVGVEGGQLLLRVPLTRIQQGFIENRIDQAVSVPVGEIVSFQRRELDRLQTGLFIGGTVAGVAAIALLILDPLRGDPERPGPDPDESIVLPIVSIPIGR
jgi:hypothetical protein